MENPENKNKQPNELRKWQAIAITLLICGALSVWGIYGFGVYGIALFVLPPCCSAQPRFCCPDPRRC